MKADLFLAGNKPVTWKGDNLMFETAGQVVAGSSKDSAEESYHAMALR